MIAEAACGPRQFFVVGCDHAAFAAGGKGLVLTETAAGDAAECAGLFTLIDPAEGLRVVFDDVKVVFPGQGVDFVHVAYVAVEMDGHDGPGALIDQFRRRLYVEAMVIEVHVGKARDGASLDHGETGSDKGVAGNNDLIARTDAQGGQGDVQRRGSSGDADGVFAALPFGVAPLEFHASLASPVVDLARTEDSFDRFDGVLVEVRPALKLVGHGLGAAVDGQSAARVFTGLLSGSGLN